VNQNGGVSDKSLHGLKLNFSEKDRGGNKKKRVRLNTSEHDPIRGGSLTVGKCFAGMGY